MRRNFTTIQRLVVAFFVGVFSVSGIGRQQVRPAAAVSAPCTRDRGLEIIEQQIDLAKTLDNDVSRVTVLVRAADLLWPYEENKARAAYAEAFELAVRNFKVKGDEPIREGKLLIQPVDQRYKVIEAIAKHDFAWAKKLLEQMLKEQQEEAKGKTGADSQRDEKTAQRLLSTAISLASADGRGAINLARNSLAYPATMYLTDFLYTVAAVDKSGADQFYSEALTAYADAPIEQFIYLSVYAFGMDREAEDMPTFKRYQTPTGFTPNQNLPRLFLQTFLRRVQDFLNNPSNVSQTTSDSDPNEMWLALTRLQPEIQQSVPDLAQAAEAARWSLSSQFSPDAQLKLKQSLESDNPPKQTFDDRVEAALKNPNVDSRDSQLAVAIMNGSKDETLEHVLGVLDSIADSSLRQALQNWLYFERTQSALKAQNLVEARRLASKVDELDQRAFLYFRIAEESLKHPIEQTLAREVLEEVVETAAKAPNTPVKARTLLGGAYLYSKFDTNRAIAIVGDAVKCINQMDQPDFSRQFVMRKIESKTFSTYAAFSTPGYNPENAFREIGKVDFDGMLNQATNFSDKLIRAMTTLSLVEQCLKNQPTVPKKKSGLVKDVKAG